MKIKELINDFRMELTSHGLFISSMGIITNLVLNFMNNYFKINLWFDTVGTFAAAVISGPWTGVLTSLLTFIILGASSVSILPYFLIGGAGSLIIGYLYRYKNLMSKKSNLIEILGTGSLIAFLSTIIYTKLNVLITGSATNFLDWIIIILMGTPDGSTNGVITGLVGPEMLAHFLDKTAALFLTYFIIRIFPQDYFTNKKFQETTTKTSPLQKRRVIRAGNKITTIRKKY